MNNDPASFTFGFEQSSRTCKKDSNDVYVTLSVIHCEL